ncbi:hypothetical protein SAMN04489724_0652 [Algoriphagus locisalis]|uniref:Uncharacterized protein n=1 Tax=Algoriphagus locisalis TaxID=305507 RepID=A0A1I6XSH2_9BACT|nr:hypothetical protein [Algoriphagus locisalis]SFT41439.1 hypothetical protein SAMN04489724_0652 [Algoriphagus locisalis]
MRNLFLIALLTLIVFFQINGEKIPVNEGTLGNGVFYRDVGRFFLDDIENAGYNLVQLTRILPFALLNLSFSTFHIVKDNQGLQNGMIIWQVIYLAIAVYWYFRISKKLRLKVAQTTLGFILLFFNYAWLKSVWYQPFTPDLMAFALGMGQVNYFLRYEKFKLGMVSILGIFVSPLLLISGLLMLFLPGEKLPVYEGQRPKSGFPVLLSLISMIAVGIAGWFIWNWSSDPLLDQLMHGLAILTFPLIIIFLAVKNSIDWEAALDQLKKRTKADRLSKGLMGFVGILLILVMLSGSNSELGIFSFIRETGNGAFRFPADFLISTALHWGLLMLFVLVYLLRFIQEMGKMGWSVCIITLLTLVLLPFLSPGTLAAWIPISGVILIKALRRYRWTKKDLILDGGIALLISLAWLSLNTDTLISYLSTRDPELLSNFGVQRWAMHQPDLISFTGLLLAGLLLSLLTAGFVLRRKKYQRVMN